MDELRFLEHANEATRNIKEITKLLTGDTDLSGGLLHDIYCCVCDMVQEYFAPIINKEIGNDEFNDIVTIIMHAEKDEINDIVKKYSLCNI